MNTIAAHWKSFEAGVVPADACDVQRQETRRAFYAGAHAMLCTVQSLGADTVSEDAGVAILEGLVAESGLFAAEVAQGRA